MPSPRTGPSSSALPVRGSITLLATLVLATYPARAANAQFCLRSRPLPRCRTFVVSEVGLARRVNPAPRVQIRLPSASSLSGDTLWYDGPAWGERWKVTTEVGALNNRGRGGWAVGASGQFRAVGGNARDYRYGLRLRVRRWLSTTTSLDLAPGVLLGSPHVDKVRLRGPTVTTYAALSVGDWIALTADVEFVRLDPGLLTAAPSTDTALYIGARVGSYTGLALAPLVYGALVFVQWMGELAEY